MAKLIKFYRGAFAKPAAAVILCRECGRQTGARGAGWCKGGDGHCSRSPAAGLHRSQICPDNQFARQSRSPTWVLLIVLS